MYPYFLSCKEIFTRPNTYYLVIVFAMDRVHDNHLNVLYCQLDGESITLCYCPRVTEQNVTSVQWLLTRRHYLVIDFTMDRLEGNHLRVLDGLLDVFGFNFTYETGNHVSNSSCSVVGCSLSGHCYASDNLRYIMVKTHLGLKSHPT